jgi:acetylornithine deacetylase/succinyl-diaminopimelate desuccinylase-like protein
MTQTKLSSGATLPMFFAVSKDWIGMNPFEYAHEHAVRFLDELKIFIRIPSVSTDSDRAIDVQEAAHWLADNMRQVGIHNVQLFPTARHPVVYGEWLEAGEHAPTILVYGHYDVQPADKDKDGWTTEPFIPVERDGKLYARGSSDDKGQMFTHVKAFEAVMKTVGKLPVNIKYLFEGEEEIGSRNLYQFVAEHRDMLRADICVLSDTGFRRKDEPAITYSTRGLCYMQIDVQGPARDLHSGGYGGIVHNPALALAQIIARLHNADNSVAVPGFYDDVIPLKPDEREELKKTDIAEDELRGEVGIPQSWGEAGYTLRERVGARPTMEINGFVSGFYGEGSKTVLPAKAMAKISCRLVANQTPERIYEQVSAYVASITPVGVTSKVSMIDRGDPAFIDRESLAMQAAIRAYEAGWGKGPIFMREGGTLPILATFRRELGIKSLLMGYGLNTDGAHGPDEHYDIEMYHLGIDTNIHFMYELAKTGV